MPQCDASALVQPAELEALARPDRAFATACWRDLEPPYRAIDWQRDHRSGARWSVGTWYRDIRAATSPGADLKVPWELARCDHLPQLALSYGLALTSPTADWPEPGALMREFTNQIRDFIATNPPRFGVNWACPMDVALRTVNWIVAHDLFRAAGAEFAPEFRTLLTRSVWQHGHHVRRHLERVGPRRNNHYLADVVGLIFAGTWLQADPETEAWLDLAVPALLEEIVHQFLPDGASFEGSTSYHRFCAEMVLHGLAVVLGSARGRRRLAGCGGVDHAGSWAVPPEVAARLSGMAAFVRDVAGPDGRLLKIGDDDGGRFLHLGPDRSDEGALVTAALDALGSPACKRFSPENTLHLGALASALACGQRVDVSGQQKWPVILDNGTALPRLPGQPNIRLVFCTPSSDLHEGLEARHYPGFGLVIFRSRRLLLTLRCGSPVGSWSHPLGHHHLDQLSVTLAVDGVSWIADPGSYLYTSSPEWRDRYRSSRAHFGPQLPRELVDRILGQGLFQLVDPPRGELLAASRTGLVGRLMHDGSALAQVHIAIQRHAIEFLATGECFGPLENLPFSPGYGRQDREQFAVAPRIWNALFSAPGGDVRVNLEEAE
jgi:hypothetical protein